MKEPSVTSITSYTVYPWPYWYWLSLWMWLALITDVIYSFSTSLIWVVSVRIRWSGGRIFSGIILSACNFGSCCCGCSSCSRSSGSDGYSFGRVGKCLRSKGTGLIFVSLGKSYRPAHLSIFCFRSKNGFSLLVSTRLQKDLNARKTSRPIPPWLNTVTDNVILIETLWGEMYLAFWQKFQMMLCRDSLAFWVIPRVRWVHNSSVAWV